MTWSTVDYWKAVQAIAAEAVEEYPDDDDDKRQEYVTQSVDGSEYIIYYGANETVLEATGNEPDGSEVKAMSADGADWRTMRMTAAYLAMGADVNDEVRKLDERPGSRHEGRVTCS